MAAGYAPGEYDPEEGLTIVRESDGHGWVQVHFPRYGWIDFEPTSKMPIPERASLAGQPGSDSELLGGGSSPLPEDILVMGDFVTGGDISAEAGTGGSSAGFAVPIALAVGGIVAAGLVLRFAWTLGLSKASPVERAYTKMSRLGTVAGVRLRANQTPNEYGAALGAAIPAVATAARRISGAFAEHKYGHPATRGEAREDLDEEWASIRGSLAARVLTRFMPKMRDSSPVTPMVQRR